MSDKRYTGPEALDFCDVLTADMVTLDATTTVKTHVMQSLVKHCKDLEAERDRLLKDIDGWIAAANYVDEKYNTLLAQRNKLRVMVAKVKAIVDPNNTELGPHLLLPCPDPCHDNQWCPHCSSRSDGIELLANEIRPIVENKT